MLRRHRSSLSLSISSCPSCRPSLRLCLVRSACLRLVTSRLLVLLQLGDCAPLRPISANTWTSLPRCRSRQCADDGAQDLATPSGCHCCGSHRTAEAREPRPQNRGARARGCSLQGLQATRDSGNPEEHSSQQDSKERSESHI